METYREIILLLAATIRVATPLVLAAIAGMYSERSGVIDLALEGKMLAAAFASAAVAAAMAINIMVAGLAPALALAWYDQGGQTPQLDGPRQRFLGLAWPWTLDP